MVYFNDSDLGYYATAAKPIYYTYTLYIHTALLCQKTS